MGAPNRQVPVQKIDKRMGAFEQIQDQRRKVIS